MENTQILQNKMKTREELLFCVLGSLFDTWLPSRHLDPNVRPCTQSVVMVGGLWIKSTLVQTCSRKCFFSECCGHSSLILHPNSANESFFEDYLKRTFSYPVFLKSIGLSCIFSGCLSQAWFYNRMRDSFSKYCFWTLCRSSKYSHMVPRSIKHLIC